MRISTRLYLILTASIFLSLPVLGQERPTSAEGERGRPSIDVSPGGTSVAARGISVGNEGSQVSMIPSSRVSSGDFRTTDNTRMAGYTPVNPVPRLEGTSFNSLNSYYLWQNFLWNLRTRYMLDALYFSRFYRNSEPLITPQLLKLAVQEPLDSSAQLLTAVDELEVLLVDAQSGKTVRRKEITEKTQEIRDLAKKIRKDNSLSFIDQRLDKNLNQSETFDKLGLQAIGQLREMATDLNTQLKTLYNQKTTSSVSVGSLSQPSFESLSKGIEKLSKVIENSARRL